MSDEERLRASFLALADEAVAALGEILRGDGSEAVRLAAAKEVLERAYGRARPREAEAAPKEPVKVRVRSYAEDAVLAEAEAAARAAARAAAATSPPAGEA